MEKSRPVGNHANAIPRGKGTEGAFKLFPNGVRLKPKTTLVGRKQGGQLVTSPIEGDGLCTNEDAGVATLIK